MPGHVNGKSCSSRAVVPPVTSGTDWKTSSFHYRCPRTLIIQRLCKHRRLMRLYLIKDNLLIWRHSSVWPLSSAVVVSLLRLLVNHITKILCCLTEAATVLTQVFTCQWCCTRACSFLASFLGNEVQASCLPLSAVWKDDSHSCNFKMLMHLVYPCLATMLQGKQQRNESAKCFLSHTLHPYSKSKWCFNETQRFFPKFP